MQFALIDLGIEDARGTYCGNNRDALLLAHKEADVETIGEDTYCNIDSVSMCV